MTIEELRDLKLRKEKVEKAIKSRAFISEINQRYNKMSDRKRKNFFKRASWFLTEICEVTYIRMCKVVAFMEWSNLSDSN